MGESGGGGGVTVGSTGHSFFAVFIFLSFRVRADERPNEGEIFPLEKQEAKCY